MSAAELHRHSVVFPETIGSKDLLRSGSYPDEERLDHAVGFPALGLAAVAVDGGLDDSHHVVAELQLGGGGEG